MSLFVVVCESTAFRFGLHLELAVEELLAVIGNLEVSDAGVGGENCGNCLTASEEQVGVDRVDNGQGFLLIGKPKEMQELSIELVDSDSNGLAIVGSNSVVILNGQATEEIELSADVGVKDHESGTVIQIYIEYGVPSIAWAGHVPLDLQI